jgi:hypothetical protein
MPVTRQLLLEGIPGSRGYLQTFLVWERWYIEIMAFVSRYLNIGLLTKFAKKVELHTIVVCEKQTTAAVPARSVPEL